jgi:hypothetical protein
MARTRRNPEVDLEIKRRKRNPARNNVYERVIDAETIRRSMAERDLRAAMDDRTECQILMGDPPTWQSAWAMKQ